MSDIKEVLNGEAFKNLDSERKRALIQLSDSIAGKPPGESIPIIMAFAAAMPKGEPIPQEERQAMITALLETMPESEQGKFRNVMKMMQAFS